MKLFEAANQYCKESTWKTLALIKFCLFSIGIMVGMHVPEGAKSAVLVVCILVFAVTYIPLMKKLFNILKRK